MAAEIVAALKSPWCNEELVSELVEAMLDGDTTVGEMREVLASLRRYDKSNGSVGIITALKLALTSASERSLGCVWFGGSGGLEILPGGGKRFARRAHRHKGYTVLIWARECVQLSRFELLGIGGGALRVEIEPSGERRWTVSVYSKGRLRCSAQAMDAENDEEADEPSVESQLGLRWRLMTVVHSWHYLTQASLEVDVGGGGDAVKLTAALPSEEDCDDYAAANASSCARSALRPPAIRALRGFSGCCGSICVYDSALSAESLAALREVGPRYTTARTPPPKPPPGEKSLLPSGAPSIVPWLSVCVSRQHRPAAALGAWCPRGGDKGEIELNDRGPPAQGITVATGEGVEIFAGGRAAKCVDALAALGGIKTLAGCLEPFGAPALQLCAAFLKRAGGSVAVQALQDRALFAVAARAFEQLDECDLEQVVDATLAVVDAAAAWPKLQAASLEAFFLMAAQAARKAVEPLMEGAAQRAVRFVLQKARATASCRSFTKARAFAAAFNIGIGLHRVARLAKGGLSPQGIDAVRVLASAALLDDLLDDEDEGEESDDDQYRSAAKEATGVVEVLDAVADDTGDPNGQLRSALLEALSLAVARAKKPTRAYVGSLLNRRAFAQTTAIALITNAPDPKPDPLVKAAFFPRHDASLRTSALKLALWQYRVAETALRAAVASAEVDDKREFAEARRAFRKTAAAHASKLAGLVTDALENNPCSAAHEAALFAVVLGLELDVTTDETRYAKLAPPPLWLTLPFLAGVLPHLEPFALAERAAAAYCARIKSSDDVFADLEPWYSVGSLMRLASHSRGSTVELLALDVVSSLVLKRRQQVASINTSPNRPPVCYELDRGALAWCAAAVPTPNSGAVANLEWASRALAAVAAAACRRLAADLGRADNDAAALVASPVPAMIAKLLAVCLDKILPPPPATDFARHVTPPTNVLGVARGLELAKAIADASRAVRKCADRALRDRLRAKAKERADKEQQRMLKPADVLRKSVVGLAKRALAGALENQPHSAGWPSHESSLLALRQCGRALAHAVYWSIEDASVCVQATVELRACIALGVELADERVAEGSPSAAVVASDDALHATACLGAKLASIRDDELENAVATALLGLVRDCVQSAGVGLATACVRAALEPAAAKRKPFATLEALKAQLDSALARDAADREDFVDELPADLWSSSAGFSAAREVSDTNSSSRQAVSSCRTDRLDALRAVAAKELAAGARRDAARELDDDVAAEDDDDDERQHRWELFESNGLCTPALVAQPIEPLDTPLRPHDDDDEHVDATASLISSSTIAQDVAKRIGAVRDVAADAETRDDVDDDDVVEDNQPPPGTMLRSFRHNNDDDNLSSSIDSNTTTVSTTIVNSPASKPATSGPEEDEDAVLSARLSSLGPTDGPFSSGTVSNPNLFSYATDRVWRVERRGLTAGAVAINRTKKWVVFRPVMSDAAADWRVSGAKRRRSTAWRMRDVAAVLLRRYRLRDTAVEIYFKKGPSLLVDCAPRRANGEGGEGIGQEDEDEARQTGDKFEASYAPEVYAAAARRRDELVRKIIACVRAARGASADGLFPMLQGPRTSPSRLLRKATRAWQERRLSNYDYLCLVNALGGRSFADPCQYPVFPWILADYESENLDLSDPNSYRDLSKPMGALNAARLRDTVARYESFVDPHVPRFHYGSHYSTSAGVVMHYLLRVAPFAELHCELQGGRFDVADRLFASVPEAWSANSGARGSSSSSEVKELTPEWFSTPAFLVNRGRLPLGVSQDGHTVADVELPRWSRGSPHAFIAANRAALESDFVSSRLHLWIDLIFGHKQRGPAAVEAHNVFFYLCYADAVDLDAIDDPKLRASTVLQVSLCVGVCGGKAGHA